MRFKAAVKSILISLLVTASLAAPAVVLALVPGDVEAYLLFQGTNMRAMPDGSVQALFSVSMHGGSNRSGATFTLDYNADYFTLSDAATNEPITATEKTDRFFTCDEDLYDGESPFAEQVNTAYYEGYYSQAYPEYHQVSMQLWLDRENITEEKGKVKLLEGYSYYDEDRRFTFADDPDGIEQGVTLGTLSFRVNPERLPEIAQYFHDMDITDDPEVSADYPSGNPSTTYLVRVVESTGNEDTWSIGYYGTVDEAEGNYTANNYNKASGNAAVFYQNNVDNDTVVSIRPANDEVTVNAYQAYYGGTVDDVALVLGQYSPMATITYLDGREENVVIPWGDATGEYTVSNGDGVPVTDYDPTQGDYHITQMIQLPQQPGTYFQIPIEVTLHVTPVTLLDIQVEDQTKTYRLDNVVNTINSPGDLALPEDARLITDIVPGGVSLTMPIPGWAPEKGTWPRLTEGNTNASTLMNALKEDSFDIANNDEYDPTAEPKWPDNEDLAYIPAETSRFLGQYNGQWLGKYTFHMAEGYGTAEDPKPTLKPSFTKAEIQDAYPWLTVPEDAYAVPDVSRQIVTTENYTDASNYVVTYQDTVDEDVLGQTEPRLTLNVARADSVAMANASIFRVWLPNGQELGTGLTATVWPGTETTVVEDWFPEYSYEDGNGGYQNGDYQPTVQTIGYTQGFSLAVNPGNPEDNDFGDERETLRRYINLGGWFYVSVTEDPATRAWSDPIPVYVPPRSNLYTESKEYNFLGDNSGLFIWAGDLTHYVSMPAGEYNDVNASGEALYLVEGEKVTAASLPESQTDSYGRPNESAVRATASYSYATTYDGLTGAQPGALTTFRVDDPGRAESVTPPARGDAWNHDGGQSTGGTTVYTYGPNPFFDGAAYGGYGVMYQQRASDNTIQDPKTATIRRDTTQFAAAGSQKITLTSVETAGITRVTQDDLTSNVTQVTYNTKEEGYTARQSYTLTITNWGTEPIYGLAIDTLTDGYPDETTGGHFVMDKAPANYLAPGSSTTFVLTYVYDLAANLSGQTYHDALYITSSDHPTGGWDKTEGEDYLLKFEAEILVSSKPIHNVNIVVKPGDLSMGTAGLIIGQQSGSSQISYTPTTRSYAEGANVYVVVRSKDEYKIYDKPTAVDALGIPVEVTEVSVPEGQDPVYVFTMPNYDTTVTVCFYEDVYSKLRLSDLIDFSSDQAENLKPDTDPVAEEDTYTVWRKSFTDGERADAETWAADHSGRPDFYLMTQGRAVPENEGGNEFLSTENQYLVVIPYDAAYSQVEATLRALATQNDYTGDGGNDDVAPTVTMNWFGADVLDTWSVTTDGEKLIYTGSGDTATPTTHTSEVFASPDPGASNYVRITVQYENTLRYYYLEIHRRSAEPTATLHYGNSPYGMIMNATNFQVANDAAATARLQNAAKEAFKENYTFQGLARNYLPAILQGDDPAVDVSKVTYWREAWVNNTQIFEPESNTGYLLKTGTAADGLTETYSYDPDPDVYDEANNLDLNDYAYFAILGEDMREPGLVEALDSSGRPVDLSQIQATAEVTLLDTAKQAQVERFSGTDTVTLDLGVANRVLTSLAADAADATGDSWPASSRVAARTETVEGETVTTETTVYTPVHNIRPGQYVITYTYPDFDGGVLSVTRPFVILSGVGDVNGDGYLDSTRSLASGATEEDKKATDEYVLENRVADPLGYEAGKWELLDGVWQETVYPRANLFKYRVCDVNNDRNVNNIDGNEIDRLARDPENSRPLRFYEPVNYGHPGDTLS